MVNENVGLAVNCQYGLKRCRGNAYPFQVSVYRIICVKVIETFCHIQ